MTGIHRTISRRNLISISTAALVASASRLCATLLPISSAGQGVATTLPKSGETLPTKTQAGFVRALLVGGGSSHDFETFFHFADCATLKAAGGIIPAYTSNVDESMAQLSNADVLVFSANDASFGSSDFQHSLNAFADAGHGLVIVHAGVWYNWPNAPAYNQRFVGGGTRSHGRGEFTVFNRRPEHPVMRGVPPAFKIIDEQYRTEFEPGADVNVLAQTSPEAQSGKAYASVWVVNDAKTKIVNIALGHANEAHGNPAYQAILVNAVRWVAGHPAN
jgi:Uncharacterized protein conserved in bacteria